jgi:hypothetical protein
MSCVCVFAYAMQTRREKLYAYVFLGLCDIAFHHLWSVMLFCFLFLCLLLTLLSSCLLSKHQVLSMASAAATQASKGLSSSSPLLSAALSNALTKVRESGVASVGLDPPHIANAFMTVGNVYAKQTKSARAKIASWRSGVSRGLWVDGFGRDATNLRQRILSTFDSETLAAAGLPLVASYRLEMRKQLQELLDNAVIDMFNRQVTNLETSTLKRFQALLLKNLNTDSNTYESTKANMDANAAALRQQTFAFETVLDDLEIPSSGLSKATTARTL